MKIEYLSLRNINSENDGDVTFTNNGEQPVTTFFVNEFWQHISMTEANHEQSKKIRKPSEVFRQYFGPEHGVDLLLR